MERRHASDVINERSVLAIALPLYALAGGMPGGFVWFMEFALMTAFFGDGWVSTHIPPLWNFFALHAGILISGGAATWWRAKRQ